MQTMMLHKKTVLGVAIAGMLALGGCGHAIVKQPEERGVKIANDVDGYLKHATRGTPSVETEKRAVRVHQQAWIPAKKITPPHMQPGFNAGLRKLIVNRDFASIQEVGERVTLLTQIPVSVASDVNEADLGGGTTSTPNGAAPSPVPPMPGMAPMPSSPFDLGGMGLGLPNTLGSNINYSGTLAGFLDVAASRFNVSWRWINDGAGIEFFRFETKTFRVKALPGKTTQTSSVSQDGSSAEGGGASAQETSISVDDMSVWTEIEDAVKSMIGSTGRVSVSPALGTLTVTGTPSTVKKVEEYVSRQNDAMSKQVVVNVTVLSVDVTDSDSYGLNWDAVYKTLAQDYNVNLTTAFAPVQGGMEMTWNVIQNGSDYNRFTGSKAIASALSTQGRVSQVTSSAVTTLNNQPVPVSVGRQIAYLQSSSVTMNGDAGSTTTMTPGTINTGFSMNLLPHILDGNQLLLQYSMDLSSLIGMDEVSSGDTMMQTPETESRKFLQRIRLNSGDTLVVSGFEQTNLDARMEGIGAASNFLLGGSVRGNQNRNAIVVLIQPIVVQ